MANEIADVATVIMAAYKDKVVQEELEIFAFEFQKLQQTEAESRRAKANALIRQMAKLKIALKQFEFSYERIIVKSNTRIPAIDDYINEIQNKIKRISFQKNNHVF